MTPRVTWFVAGAAAGLYASVKARRAAYRLSAPGLVDQAAALGVGVREFLAEFDEGARVRRRDLAERLHADVPDHLYLENPEKDPT